MRVGVSVRVSVRVMVRAGVRVRLRVGVRVRVRVGVRVRVRVGVRVRVRVSVRVRVGAEQYRQAECGRWGGRGVGVRDMHMMSGVGSTVSGMEGEVRQSGRATRP